MVCTLRRDEQRNGRTTRLREGLATNDRGSSPRDPRAAAPQCRLHRLDKVESPCCETSRPTPPAQDRDEAAELVEVLSDRDVLTTAGRISALDFGLTTVVEPA